MAILRGLGISPRFQPLRWTEERTTSGRTMVRQRFPYHSTRYASLKDQLLSCLPPSMLQYSLQATTIDQRDSSVHVTFSDGSNSEYDMVLGADGPRSMVRSQLFPQSELRFAGYSAWRGLIRTVDLSAPTREKFVTDFPLMGDCIYFVHCPDPRQHAVVYDIGDGVINWLIYQNVPHPNAASNRATAAASLSDVQRLRATAVSHWGIALGQIVAQTPDPFWTDVYDLAEPLTQFHRDHVALVGDSAHAITPHCLKGSNLAIQDAYTLACCAHTAASVPDMLQNYSKSRASHAGNMVLLSRHVGRLRNGLLTGMDGVPVDQASFERWLASSGLDSALLPRETMFAAVWRALDYPEAVSYTHLTLPTKRIV
eukprot:TRINITY_DN17630_c0_g1_i3.p1 TRINITY_DN17630_c0_g1~~TRINITY_DN17630_c0_g1_i3.p1  ORF type:complete len:369 (-),score=66.89 TRINITY_DN17630_c0_g1_i3:88-1194(-)